MKNAASLLSSAMTENQSNKSNDTDQTCLDPSSATSSSSTNEPENKPDEGRNGIIAI